ncbi:MAG TPA: DUF932 domain-containing protein [Bacteroidetes bacterium]|nr:hypothetical protein BMS3Bbin04_01150 [bacterium BMS3Bbin04]HDO65864.1 DUF932 domain-containing protein [Bacteroidota bacterium]HEX04989.1 DUF932 domain-containing protein [Bacteroidota bacterium]
MPRKAVQYSDPFVPVTKVPLSMPDGSASSRYAVMLTTDTGPLEVGTVSSSYQLVPNEIVSQIAEDVLSRTDMPFEDGGHIFDGKRFRHRWVLPNLVVEPRVDDIVNLTFDIVNSYDGSTTVGVAFNAQRLVCGNGMMVDWMLGGFKFRHINCDDFAEELQFAAEKVRRLGQQLEPLSRRLNSMIDVPITRADTQGVFRELKLPMSLRAEVFDSIADDDAWGLLNGFTDVLTKHNSHNADNTNRRVMKYLLAA